MASKEDYAQWCVDLMLGDTYMIDDLYEALKEDKLVDEDGEWIYEDEE